MSVTFPSSGSLEAHYSLAQIAEAWGISVDTVRRLFEGEPGVLVIEPPQSRFTRRRRYRTLRIPASVVDRVHRRMEMVITKAER